MQAGKLTIRRRVFAVCLCLSLLTVVVVSGLGIYFRHVLRERAVKRSEEIAAIFCKLATRRVGQLVSESWAIAQSLANPVAHRGSDSVLCSWAVYDDQGGRTLGQHLGSDAARLAHLGIGVTVLPDRERRRVATVSEEGPSMVIVPDDSRAYVVLYHAVRQGDSEAYLQTATEVGEATFSLISQVARGQVVLRPFMSTKEGPRVELIHREPNLIFHRSFQYAGRSLGTITAAVPYAREAAYERNVLYWIAATAAVCLASLLGLSFWLSRSAVEPLEKVVSYVTDIQTGRNVERQSMVVPEEFKPLMQAFNRQLNQSQEWVDVLLESKRTIRDLLCGAAEALVNAMEAKDEYTAGHSQRVSTLACQVAGELGWEREEIESLRLGGKLHDIGKVGVHDMVLNKPGKLNDEEFGIIRQHPSTGARILSAIPGCEDLIAVTLHHHERFDGKGYPMRTVGADTPRIARLAALSDVWDALTSRRSYRAAFAFEDAINMMEEGVGTTFDPELAEAFLAVVRRDQPTAASLDAEFATEAQSA